MAFVAFMDEIVYNILWEVYFQNILLYIYTLPRKHIFLSHIKQWPSLPDTEEGQTILENGAKDCVTEVNEKLEKTAVKDEDVESPGEGKIY